MDVDISRTTNAETPASAIREDYLGHVTALMAFCGIESISIQKHNAGYGSKLHATISMFAEAPKEITAQGIVVKDAIAQLLSIANINRVVIKPNEVDLGEIRASWKMAVHDAAVANRGSGQDFTTAQGAVEE